MLSRVFIDRPIFAWVLAIIVMLGGIGAIMSLPIAQYPDVAPPQVTIRATFPGANAQTIQNSVTQVVEQSLTGIDGLIYFSSSSSSREGNAQSISSIKNIEFFGIEEAARARKASSTLYAGWTSQRENRTNERDTHKLDASERE